MTTENPTDEPKKESDKPDETTPVYKGGTCDKQVSKELLIEHQDLD